MKTALPLAVSFLVFLGFLYGASWSFFLPRAVDSAPLQMQGLLLMIPALLWWFISLIKLARERRWVWFAGFLVLLPLAPLATLAYDMSAVREVRA